MRRTQAVEGVEVNEVDALVQNNAHLMY
jgi:hypothetical protein